MAITRTGAVVFAISCGMDGANIHYTTDGSTPTPDSPIYSEVQKTYKNLIVKALGIKSGAVNSNIIRETITVVLPTPVISQSVDGDTMVINVINSYSNYNGVTFQMKKDSGAYSAVSFPYTITANGVYKIKAVSAGENQNSEEVTIYSNVLKVKTPVITVS